MEGSPETAENNRESRNGYRLFCFLNQVAGKKRDACGKDNSNVIRFMLSSFFLFWYPKYRTERRIITPHLFCFLDNFSLFVHDFSTVVHNLEDKAVMRAVTSTEKIGIDHVVNYPALKCQA